MTIDDVARPATVQEAVASLKRRPDAILWAGGTLLMSDPSCIPADRLVSIVDIGRLPELAGIHRTERYVEVGAAVTLASLLALPKPALLGPLAMAAAAVGTASVRNLATLGGTIACRNRFMSCFAALSCMDAAVELRDPRGVRWHGIHKLVGPGNRPAFPEASMLTRVRLPHLSWDAVVVRALGDPPYPHPDASTFAACARIEQGVLADLRVAVSGRILVRDRSLEMTLAGRRLPLSRREIGSFSSDMAASALALSIPPDISSRLEAYVSAFLDHPEEYAL
ncbi:MAG: FAD binding domain-containing protein [Spirochaetales bacterium]|nr:FAD binding domain-containing protein [Spirochaetales bacterium]MBP7263893.1 FAD binding domain-containing protein [Spirochaetia bacterium]